MPFSVELPVRFSDTDKMGHVNHARFLFFAEDARIALLGQVPGDGASSLRERGLILARAEMDYVRPLVLSDDPVRVTLTVERIGTSSVTLRHVLEQAGEVAGRGSVVVVSYDYAAEAPQPLTDADRAALEDLAGA